MRVPSPRVSSVHARVQGGREGVGEGEGTCFTVGGGNATLELGVCLRSTAMQVVAITAPSAPFGFVQTL